MMNNHDESYRNMLASFRTNDLQALLAAFGRNKAGRKSELKERALELLRTRPTGFNHAAYVAKIYEIYRSMQSDLPHNDIMMRNLLSTQQRQMMNMGQIQNTQQRMYQPPQYPQQSMHMTRAGLPQVMPQIQRSIYGNSIGANTIANNNIQYISGSYQPSGPRSIASSHLSSNQQMNAVPQDGLGYDNMNGSSGGNNPYVPSPEIVAKIKFKKLPFYEVIDEMIKPTFLAGTDRCTLQSFPRGKQYYLSI